jgi:ATP dependent DNA ligase domain
LIEIKHDGFRIIARKSGGQVRLYSRPGNDFTRRFPLIADAPPEWLSKKCWPLSKKCKLNRPQPNGCLIVAEGASKREEGNYENPRPMPWKAGIGYPLP